MTAARLSVSVAIATRNRPAGLKRLLDSLLGAADLPVEVLVVDQSDGEETAQMLAARPSAPVPLIYLRQAPLGLSASRNLAASRARGDILAFTDDDCVAGPDWVATISACLSGPDAPQAISGRVLPLGPEQPGTYPVSIRDRVRPAEFRGRQLPWLVGTGGNLAVRRQDWLGIGPFDVRLGAGSPGRAGEDLEWIYRALRCGARLRYEPAMLIYHERQPRAQRVASFFGYACGVGASCGLILRRGDGYAVVILLVWLYYWLRSLVLNRHWSESWLKLRGVWYGLGYGLRLAPEMVIEREKHGTNH